MTLTKWSVLVALLMLLCIPLSSHAQDDDEIELTQKITTEDGAISFMVPEDWFFSVDDESTSVGALLVAANTEAATEMILESTNTSVEPNMNEVFFMVYDRSITALLLTVTPEDLPGAMDSLLDDINLFSDTSEHGEFMEISTDTLDGISTTVATETFDAALYLMGSRATGYVLIIAGSATGKIDAALPLLNTIAGSLTLGILNEGGFTSNSGRLTLGVPLEWVALELVDGYVIIANSLDITEVREPGIVSVLVYEPVGAELFTDNTDGSIEQGLESVIQGSTPGMMFIDREFITRTVGDNEYTILTFSSATVMGFGAALEVDGEFYYVIAIAYVDELDLYTEQLDLILKSLTINDVATSETE